MHWLRAFYLSLSVEETRLQIIALRPDNIPGPYIPSNVESVRFRVHENPTIPSGDSCCCCLAVSQFHSAPFQVGGFRPPPYAGRPTPLMLIAAASANATHATRGQLLAVAHLPLDASRSAVGQLLDERRSNINFDLSWLVAPHSHAPAAPASRRP